MEKKNFDFAELETADTHTATVVHPGTGDEIEGVTITVYGQDSAQFKAATSRMRSRITEFIHRNPGLKPEDRQKHMDKFEWDRNVSCIKSIDGMVYKGEPVTDPQSACEMFGWMYDFANTMIANRANFIKGSSAK